MLVTFAAASLAFALMHFAPGDPIAAMAYNSNIPPEQVEAWRKERGYDKPLAVQYVRWINDVAHGDFGRSTTHERPVIDVIGDRLPNTLLLMGLAIIASVMFGTALGAWQGVRSGSRADRVISHVTLFVYSIPEFWLAMVLILTFVMSLHWLPASGMYDTAMHDTMSFGGKLVDRLRHLVLPWLSLTIVGAAVIARYQRESVVAASQLPFVRTARAKGLTESTVRRHIWRNALLPIITIVGLILPALVTGAVFIERIFGWPGLGLAMFKAVGDRDYELVSGCMILGSAITALANLLADVVRTLVDPRLRTS